MVYPSSLGCCSSGSDDVDPRCVLFACVWFRAIVFPTPELKETQPVDLQPRKCQQGWTGGEFPQETKCLLRLLSTNRMAFQLPWEAFELSCNVGVRQGSTESPGIFSKLLDTILQEVAQPQQDNPFPDLPVGESAFMDGVLCWRRSMSIMQGHANLLTSSLAKAG